jgi:hypothetical protein
VQFAYPGFPFTPGELSASRRAVSRADAGLMGHASAESQMPSRCAPEPCVIAPGRYAGDAELFLLINSAGDHEWFPAVRTATQAEAELGASVVVASATVRCCGEVVAHAALARPEHSDRGFLWQPDSDAFELVKIMVTEDHRGLGLGRSVAFGLLEYAGEHQIYLTTLPELVDMYAAWGFVTVDSYAGAITRRPIEVMARGPVPLRQQPTGDKRP